MNVLLHPEAPWNWFSLSTNPNITWDIIEANPDKEALADFVIKTFRHTHNDQIAFSPEFTCCLECGKTARGLTANCQYCNSEKVDGITRITGYFTKISSWNKGKLGELSDRYRNDDRFVQRAAQ